MFETFFPKIYDHKSVYNALLDFTRHTPRDFVDGIKEYSLEYFIQEIRDEMAGYVQTEDSDLIIKCLSSLRKIIFDYSEIRQRNMEYSANASEDKLVEILRVLYDCSAIGHTYSYDGGNTERITFKCRNRNSAFSNKYKICIHKGLWKALNVNYKKIFITYASLNKGDAII